MRTQDFIVFFYVSSVTLYMGGYTALIINAHHEEVAGSLRKRSSRKMYINTWINNISSCWRPEFNHFNTKDDGISAKVEVATVANWQSHLKTEIAQCSCS